MELSESEPSPKKPRLYCRETKLMGSFEKDTGIDREMCTNNTACLPSSSSRDMHPEKPRAILHDKYCRSLEKG